MDNFRKPLAIGTLTAKNRLMMPALATGTGDEDGSVTEATLEHYAERARGGYLGIIVTEHCFVSEQGRASLHQLSIASDDKIPGMARLAQTIRQRGTLAFCQINHAGSAAMDPALAVAPSAVANPAFKGNALPHALEERELDGIVEDFAAAAVRVRQAGFDGVQIHSAHGYLLNQFYSPLTNKRTDPYGPQSIENRLRLTLRIIDAVRQAAGPDYPISVRLGGADYLDGGSSIKDAVAAGRLLEQAGIQMLDLSGGMCRHTRPGHSEPGYFSDMSKPVAKALDIPVALTGGVTEEADVKLLLKRKCADLIGVGRALFRNPQWAQNVIDDPWHRMTGL